MPSAAPELVAVFRKPFAEQVAFFRGKLGTLVPTAKWDDLWKSQHDRAFMVAGAAKADLLADLAAAVDKAIHDGETIQQFRARFHEIIQRHGWAGFTGDDRTTPTDKGGKGLAWRTRIIYQTNLATSYAAGRLAQLKEAGFPLWVYRHSGSEHPRLQHLAWDGLTLPADHPFWQTHYPPSGWGCRCRVVGADGPKSAARLGGKPGYTEPPAGWDEIDPKTGEMVGIDKGWGYMPGAASGLVREIERKMASLPAPLAQAVSRDLGLEAPKPFGDRLRRIGEQTGSVPGGLYEDSATGDRWYVKFYSDPDQARSEAAALSLYRRLGLTTPDVEIATVDGRVAIASRWMEGLKRATAEELAAHPDLPRLWQGAILTKEWDVVGRELDNVFLDARGRLVKLDAGGAFRFRAQGGAKEYDRSIDEVKSLRDPQRNPAAAKVFNARFVADVFSEADGIEAVKSLKRAQVSNVFEQAGFPADEAKRLTATLWARRAALIDRYGEADLDRVPGARALRDRMRAWGTTPLRGGDVEGDLLPRFERLLADELGSWAPESARIMIGSRSSGWVTSANTPAGAVMKQWAADRFGAKITYHGGTSDIADAVSAGISRTLRASGRSLEDLDRLLDAEYAFHQYYLRRLHGWDDLTLRRGMDPAEYEAHYRRGRFEANALSSWSTGAGFFGRRVQATIPVGRVLKTYHQGKKYLMVSEQEYIVIGGGYAAKTLR
ncbi:MAG: hypothetical protein KatS3mg124_1852 [Porticoccaceae bacterium]|nr:MAG: hypothetical protein KatS3mg124_1852 [Porticoccaceae bacterium]